MISVLKETEKKECVTERDLTMFEVFERREEMENRWLDVEETGEGGQRCLMAQRIADEETNVARLLISSSEDRYLIAIISPSP